MNEKNEEDLTKLSNEELVSIILQTRKEKEGYKTSFFTIVFSTHRT